MTLGSCSRGYVPSDHANVLIRDLMDCAPGEWTLPHFDFDSCCRNLRGFRVAQLRIVISAHVICQVLRGLLIKVFKLDVRSILSCSDIHTFANCVFSSVPRVAKDLAFIPDNCFAQLRQPLIAIKCANILTEAIALAIIQMSPARQVAIRVHCFKIKGILLRISLFRTRLVSWLGSLQVAATHLHDTSSAAMVAWRLGRRGKLRQALLHLGSFTVYCPHSWLQARGCIPHVSRLSCAILATLYRIVVRQFHVRTRIAPFRLKDLGKVRCSVEGLLEAGHCAAVDFALQNRLTHPGLTSLGLVHWMWLLIVRLHQ